MASIYFPLIDALTYTALPAVSVLMPCFNSAPFLHEAVASVLCQPECLELIVADGGSSDGSLQAIEALSREQPRLRLILGPDEGPAHALNKAFALARGTLIGWLNADDILQPDALERAVRALVSNQNWLMVYGEGEEINASTTQRQRYPTLQPQVGLSGFLSHCFICQPTVVFRRSMGVLLGPFNQRWRTAFDFDYWMRAFVAFPDRIGYIPTLQGLTRVHGSTITSRQRAQVALEATALLAHHFGYAPPERLHAYALELQLGVAKLPPETSLRDHLAATFALARSWLTPADYNQLRCDWLLDSSTAALQIADEEQAGVHACTVHPAVPLLQIVQPHLRPGQPGPPAGPSLRLQGAVAAAKPVALLLQQAIPFQQLLQGRIGGREHCALPFGVNLFHDGSASTETLIWTETLLGSLHSAQVSVAICEPSSKPGPYAINLACLSPIAHAEWWLIHGLAPHQGRLEIAAWPWIASGLPDAWKALLSLVDEVWAPSRLVLDAIHKQHMSFPWAIPHAPLPPAVVSALQAQPSPPNPTIVLVADLGGSSHLVNSFAAVEVFREAFPLPPPGISPVDQLSPRLLILVENGKPDDPEWLWLKSCAANDSRIQLCSLHSLPLLERLALIQQAQVLLSLPRSYALPSLLAAAQTLGLQVVATAFGAALDLAPSPNLHLVPARSVPIPRSACLDGEGFEWGEPDREAAVELLRAAVHAGRCTPSQDQEPRLSSAPAQLERRLRQLWDAHSAAR